MAMSDKYRRDLEGWIAAFVAHDGEAIHAHYPDMSPAVVTTLLRDFYQDMETAMDRAPRRWTRSSVREMMQREGSRWHQYGRRDLEAVGDILLGFLVFMTDEGHINNGSTVGNGVWDFIDWANANSDEPVQAFNLDVTVHELADYLGERDELMLDQMGYMQDHLVDIFITAQYATGVELALAAAVITGVADPTPEHMTDWVDRYVMPDLNIEGLAHHYGADLTNPATEQQFLDEIRRSFLTDDLPVPTDGRIAIAARLDGYPLIAGESAQAEFVKRHALALQMLEGLEHGDMLAAAARAEMEAEGKQE